MLLLKNKRLLSLSLVGSKSYRQAGVSQCSKFRIASALDLHLAIALLCNCCHDPIIVRSAQTCPLFTGFAQLAHPSRCSLTTLTTVSFCIRYSSSCVLISPGSVHVGSLSLSGLQSRHQIHHRLHHLHLFISMFNGNPRSLPHKSQG